jgi:hypothetical protein
MVVDEQHFVWRKPKDSNSLVEIFHPGFGMSDEAGAQNVIELICVAKVVEHKIGTMLLLIRR